MISYGRQHIDQNDINSVTRTLKSRLITQGPLVSKFEKELCKETGYKYDLLYQTEQPLFT